MYYLLLLSLLIFASTRFYIWVHNVCISTQFSSDHLIQKSNNNYAAPTAFLCHITFNCYVHLIWFFESQTQCLKSSQCICVIYALDFFIIYSMFMVKQQFKLRTNAKIISCLHLQIFRSLFIGHFFTNNFTDLCAHLTNWCWQVTVYSFWVYFCFEVTNYVNRS